MPEVCRSCKTPIVWTHTEKGKSMPVDAERAADGNIVLSMRGERWPVAVYQSKQDIETLKRQAATRGEELLLYKSHFATCPNAAAHRSRR